jgi:hypothetical protein
MPDETRRDPVAPGGAFDDDRLLAFALGLDDDPELAAAAAADGELGARLETVRAQADAVGARVSAAVPAPGEGYADLSAPRWAALGDFFDAPPPARSRSSRWLRVLAPALAVVLALAIGAAIISSRGGGHVSMSGSVAAEASKSSATGAGAQDGATSSSTTATRGADLGVSLTDQAKRFALVVVARAREASGAFQEFAVVRNLKGIAPNLLRLRVAGEPAEAGKLDLLLLSPSGTASQAFNEPPPLISVSPAATVIATATPSPEPAPNAAASAQPGAAPASAPPAPSPQAPAAAQWVAAEPTKTFAYRGQVALAEELPPGTDVASLSVP